MTCECESNRSNLMTSARNFLLNRRRFLQGTGAAAIGMSLPVGASTAMAQTPTVDLSAGVRGGTLKVAIAGEPPTLDIHQTTAGIVSLITWVMYEPLFTYDYGFQIIPMLAESHEVSTDGLVNTIKLRQGVMFHNGEEMKSADVIASITRWATKSGHGEALVTATNEIVAVDDYTVEFRMKQPYGSFLATLAENYQGCAIYPKSVIDAAGETPIQSGFVGTGPYQFAEWQPDRYIRFQRYEGYSNLAGEPNGHGGHKYQYLEEIQFIPVSDEAAAVVGLQAGDYDYLTTVSSDQYGTLSQDSNLIVQQLPPNDTDVIVLNWRSPLMGNQTLRDAVQAAIDSEPILFAAHGEGYYRLDPGVMLKETAWGSQAGGDRYNRKDPERAKQLLTEAGYDGTPIRFMSTQEYQYLYNISLVATQQLEAAGFTVDLQTYDWATLVERRADPELWDLFPTSYPFSPDPTQLSLLQLCKWPGWWCSDATSAIFNELRSESDFAARFAAWEQIQTNFYNEIPMIKVGDFSSIAAFSGRIGGFVPMTQLAVPFWNMWLNS